MWIRLIGSLGLYEVTVISLEIFQIIPEGALWRILEDFPVLALILLVLYYQQKINRDDAAIRQKINAIQQKINRDDAAIQRESIREAHQENYLFLGELIKQIENKQNEMLKCIITVEEQLAINTATVNEIAQVDSIVSDLIARLEKK